MNDIDRKVYNEQIRLIYNQATTLVAGSSICAVAITVFLWRLVPHSSLLYWLGAVGISTVLRLWTVFLYLNSDSQAREKPIWGGLFWVGMLSAGMIWGAWPLMFYSLYSAEYLLLTSTIFAGMVAVSGASGSLYLPSFLAFSVPLVLPLSVAHLLSGRDSLSLVGMLLIVFLAINLFLAVRGNKLNRELICSQLENLKLMESLAAEKQIAERAVVAKSRFLASASHDLRQPLHAMGLFLSALRNREKEPQKIKIIEDMSKSADALNSLFNSLLDVSRLDAEIIDFNPVHVPATRVFDALRAQFGQQASKKDIKLYVRAEQHVLYCDVILLERVLRNLFANAIQYTAEGSISLNCEDRSDGAKLITLRDTGIGIPGEYVEDVFSEYYQLNNPARDRNKGLGLGLAIVRRLCDLMDIPLEMESVEGEGTVFRVIVPAGDSAQIVAQRTQVTGVLAQGWRILVIDDELQVLQSMRHMLEGWGCEVFLARSARDALKALALSNVVPDVIISDYRLADNLNGVDAIAVVRESVDTLVPAIVVTGDTSPARLKEVVANGLQLLHKPVRPAELNDLMHMLMSESDRLAAAQMPGLKSVAN